MKAYDSAIDLLQSRRRLARPQIIPIKDQDLVDASDTLMSFPNVRGVPNLQGMKHWLHLLGHSDNAIRNLNVIHVTGTKGKGSTCAFVNSFLQANGSRKGFPHKIGLYTSPDLGCVRERIQINSKPISEEIFTQYLFEVWDCVSKQTMSSTGPNQQLPRFLQLLTLLAIHTFIREEVDATVMETNLGGEFDATNVIHQPIATGITSIGLDHLAQLGPCIENVAWHKAGIFKPGAPAFCSPQDPRVSAMLRSRATDKGVQLNFVKINESLPADSKALLPVVQKVNSSLALALVDSFLNQKTPTCDAFLGKADIEMGLQNFHWPGRFEVLVDEMNKWFIDGAHNELSIRNVAYWFSQCVTVSKSDGKGLRNQPTRILIFTHLSADRDGPALLQALYETLEDCQVCFEHVIFTTNQERRDGSKRRDNFVKTPDPALLALPAQYAEFWKLSKPQSSIFTIRTIEEALEMAKTIGKKNGGMETLITGELFLVGSALNLLRRLD